MADESKESLQAVREEKLRKIAALGIDPWGCRFDGHQPIREVREITVPEGAGDAVVGPTVRVAGRIMLRRGQGKVNFLQLRDWTGAIQILVGKNQIGELGWSLAELLDLGDWLGVDGTLGLTKTGELTVFATVITILGKSLLPPPEKWHGLTDVEQRSRQRYIDLFSNPESLEVFLGRSKILSAFRKVLGGARIRRGGNSDDAGDRRWREGGPPVHHTHHNTLDLQLYLRIALEPGAREARLLVGGMEGVFEIGRVFRNEGISPKHNPEFTMLEAYQAFGDYHAMMELTEALILGAIDALDGRRERTLG